MKTKFPYQRRIKSYSKFFLTDVLETVGRLHRKDAKAYGRRVWKSVSRRFKCDPWKVYIVLNYYEYIGVLKVRLETTDEYISRMHDKPGLFSQGRRRKYYEPNPALEPSPVDDNYKKSYKKLDWEELGIPPPDYEYPL